MPMGKIFGEAADSGVIICCFAVLDALISSPGQKLSREALIQCALEGKFKGHVNITPTQYAITLLEKNEKIKHEFNKYEINNEALQNINLLKNDIDKCIRKIKFCI